MQKEQARAVSLLRVPAAIAARIVTPYRFANWSISDWFVLVVCSLVLLDWLIAELRRLSRRRLDQPALDAPESEWAAYGRRYAEYFSEKDSRT